MYQQIKSSWLKHWDFILFDYLCIALSYYFAYDYRFEYGGLLDEGIYKTMFIVISASFLLIHTFDHGYSGILGRGVFRELWAVIQFNALLLGLMLAYSFATHTIGDYSRIQIFLFIVIDTVLMFVVRCLLKSVLYVLTNRKSYARHIVVVTNQKRLSERIALFSGHSYQSYVADAFFFSQGETLTKDLIEEGVKGTTRKEILEYAKKHVVDEVFIDTDVKDVEQIVYAFIRMGVPVHLSIESIMGDYPNVVVEKVNGSPVLTTAVNNISPLEACCKRTLDILGACVGLVITGVVFLFAAPKIRKQAPGPIFFSQKRIGKNGRVFKIYKFRSMYMDAEERKAELMEQNKMQGLMFKMDNDPRIFPFGQFLRDSSLDELPQFWNVLKGDMSLVGTRPPTLDEYEQYEIHHLSRMATKPGITGMWQVSGRSDITDFEQVVKLDNQYIANWSLILDIKILFKTVLVVLLRKGSQ